jgi:hypothetical protein
MQELLPNILKVMRDEASGGWGYSYFVKRTEGNIFFARMANTASIQHEYEAIHTLGGIHRIYITDYHFAGENVQHVAQEFGAEIYCSLVEVPKIKKRGIDHLRPFDYIPHDIEPNLNVIPTPGHTTGGVCYLLRMDGVRYLFTGDFLYYDGKQWIVGSKDYNRVKDSLDRLQALEFDYLVGCGDEALGSPYMVMSSAQVKIQLFEALMKH